MTNTNTAVNTNNIILIDRDYAATIRRQSWSQTRAIERRIEGAEPVWTAGDNGDSKPWDWVNGEYTALYLLPKYGYIAYHRTGANGSEAIKTEDGGYVGGSALYAVNPWSINSLTCDRANSPCWGGVAEHLQFEAVELTHSRN
jgi:hypothetical protein